MNINDVNPEYWLNQTCYSYNRLSGKREFMRNGKQGDERKQDPHSLSEKPIINEYNLKIRKSIWAGYLDIGYILMYTIWVPTKYVKMTVSW